MPKGEYPNFHGLMKEMERGIKAEDLLNKLYLWYSLDYRRGTKRELDLQLQISIDNFFGYDDSE